MRECDREVHRNIPVAHMPRQSNRTPDGLRFVSDIGEAFYTREDANASLQKSDPENYGPYLQEGEKYNTPRNAENLEKAYAEMNGDEDKRYSSSIRSLGGSD